MAHAERWLLPRYRRIQDDMPKPFSRHTGPAYVRGNEPDLPHPGGHKRVFKVRRMLW
jgi:hypothetical protein